MSYVNAPFDNEDARAEPIRENTSFKDIFLLRSVGCVQILKEWSRS